MATITYKDISDNLRLITIANRLDIQGTEKIESALATLTTAAKRNVVVDLAEVTFLSSVGIRALIADGKALKVLGGNMALVVGLNAAVTKTLKTTCVDAILPMFETFAQAEASLKT